MCVYEFDEDLDLHRMWHLIQFIYLVLELLGVLLLLGEGSRSRLQNRLLFQEIDCVVFLRSKPV